MTNIQLELPDVGEGLDQAEILTWHVAVGDHVDRDQIVVEVQTDKSAVELPAPAAGVIEARGGEEGEMLPVGAVVVTIRPDDAAGDREETAPGSDTPRAAASADPAATASNEGDRSAGDRAVATAGGSSGGGSVGGSAGGDGTAASQTDGRTSRRPKASPATRRRARELGIDLSEIQGSGPGGRITDEDLTSAAGTEDEPEETVDTTPDPSRDGVEGRDPSSAIVTAEDRIVPLRGIRRRISETMTAAWREVPHITDLREVDATGLVQARRALRPRIERTGRQLTYLPLLVMIVARALREHPSLNASLDADAGEITYRGGCHLGVATATEKGLLVPVVRDADQRSLAELVGEIDRLADAARDGSLSPADSRGSTFTVSNSGSYGSTLGTPIIRPPEAGILGLGRIHDAVVAHEGEAVVRPVLPLSASADHRLIDGHVLGAFVNTVAELVADPILLLAEGS